MDEKNRPSFENTRKFLNNNESRENNSNLTPDQIQQKISSIDFWSSRGNMGEKINLLVGLNLLVINLVSTLVQALRRRNVLINDIIPALNMIQELLSKMITQPESGLELTEKIEIIHSTLSSMIEEISGTSTKPGITSIKPPEDTVGLFTRKAVYLDKWGIVESLEKLIASYSNLSHLAFPNYYLAACKDLLRYEVQKELDIPNQHEIIQIPSFKLKILISKLLREAPAARLLQNLRRMFPTEHDSDPTSTEQNEIQKIVERYYKAISEYFKNGLNLQDSLRVSSNILKNYNLGTGDLESRIPNVSFNVVKEIHLELQEASGNDFKQYILSESIILIHRLNDSILQYEKFIFFLRRLK